MNTWGNILEKLRGMPPWAAAMESTVMAEQLISELVMAGAPAASNVTVGMKDHAAVLCWEAPMWFVQAWCEATGVRWRLSYREGRNTRWVDLPGPPTDWCDPRPKPEMVFSAVTEHGHPLPTVYEANRAASHKQGRVL